MKKTIWFWLSIAAMCVGIGCAACDIWRGKFSGFDLAVDVIIIAWNGLLAMFAHWDAKMRIAEIKRPRREWP